jgi:Family of unknown function (DUF5763)
MDRFLTVNDSSGRGNAFDAQKFPPPDLEDSLNSTETPPFPLESVVSDPQGPCLYLGPQGQRCTRPARADGFCSRHQPGLETTKPGSGGAPRIAAAGIGILAALWPIIFDVLRVIIRWIHAHG